MTPPSFTPLGMVAVALGKSIFVNVPFCHLKPWVTFAESTYVPTTSLLLLGRSSGDDNRAQGQARQEGGKFHTTSLESELHA
jgi:hypothetical protein